MIYNRQSMSLMEEVPSKARQKSPFKSPAPPVFWSTGARRVKLMGYASAGRKHCVESRVVSCIMTAKILIMGHLYWAQDDCRQMFEGVAEVLVSTNPPCMPDSLARAGGLSLGVVQRLPVRR